MRPFTMIQHATVILWLLLVGVAAAGTGYDAASVWGDNGAPHDSCDSCGWYDHCNCDCGYWGGHWIAGSEFTFLHSELSTGGNVTMSFDDSNTVGTELQLVGGNGIDNFNFAPRMWVGRQINDRWGIVGRYWYLNDWVVAPPDSPPGAANLQTFLTTSDTSLAELYTVDLEGIRSASIGKVKLDASVGARHASFKTEGALEAFGVITSGSFAQMQLSTASQFHGTGVTGALTGRRQLGDFPLYLFLSGRGSTLGGTAFSRARAVGTVAVSPNAPLVGAATVTRTDDSATMSIAEMQAGLQWEMELYDIPANVFLRSAFEYQHWTIHSLPVGGAGFGGTIGNITTNSFASANHGEAILYGYSFAAGITW